MVIGFRSFVNNLYFVLRRKIFFDIRASFLKLFFGFIFVSKSSKKE